MWDDESVSCANKSEQLLSIWKKRCILMINMFVPYSLFQFDLPLQRVSMFCHIVKSIVCFNWKRVWIVYQEKKLYSQKHFFVNFNRKLESASNSWSSWLIALWRKVMYMQVISKNGWQLLTIGIRILVAGWTNTGKVIILKGIYLTFIYAYHDVISFIFLRVFAELNWKAHWV